MLRQGFYYPSNPGLTPNHPKLEFPNGGRQNRDKMIVVQMDPAGPTVTGFISDV